MKADVCREEELTPDVTWAPERQVGAPSCSGRWRSTWYRRTTRARAFGGGAPWRSATCGVVPARGFSQMFNAMNGRHQGRVGRGPVQPSGGSPAEPDHRRSRRRQRRARAQPGLAPAGPGTPAGAAPQAGRGPGGLALPPGPGASAGAATGAGASRTGSRGRHKAATASGGDGRTQGRIRDRERIRGRGSGASGRPGGRHLPGRSGAGGHRRQRRIPRRSAGTRPAPDGCAPVHRALRRRRHPRGKPHRRCHRGLRPRRAERPVPMRFGLEVQALPRRRPQPRDQEPTSIYRLLGQRVWPAAPSDLGSGADRAGPTLAALPG